MLINKPMNFHHDILNGCLVVTEHKRQECKVNYFPKGHNSKNMQRKLIYMNLVEFLSLMHHAMFGNHRPSGSREDKKIQVFPIYSHFSIYWSCDLGHLYKLSFPIP